MNENEIEKGDTVEYTYRHWLNSNSSTLISKTGKFISASRKTEMTYKNPNGEKMARVKFTMNKTVSVVPLSKIKLIKKKKHDEDE